MAVQLRSWRLYAPLVLTLLLFTCPALLSLGLATKPTFEIITYPNEILRQQAAEISRDDTETIALLNEMEDFLEAGQPFKGGLALPQLGISKRGFVVLFDGDAIVMINPKVTRLEGQQPSFEGCLSIPGEYGWVSRYVEVIVEYLDEDWQKQSMRLSGLSAFATQHENDHLNGIIIIDKLLPPPPPREI